MSLRNALRKLSVPHVLSAMALVVALTGGTAYALVGKNSVDSGDIRSNAVRSADIKNGQVAGRDLSGPITVSGPPTFLGTSQADAVGASVAQCPGGSRVTGGGWNGGSSPPVDATVAFNEELGNGWEVIMVNNASITSTFAAVARCIGVGGARPGLSPRLSVKDAALHQRHIGAIKRSLRRQP